MKRLILLLILAVFVVSGATLAEAGHDGNRNSVRRAWNAIQAQQKKDAAAEKVLFDQAQTALASPRSNRER